MPLTDMLLGIVVVAVWGINFVFVKIGVSDMPPLLLSALRFVVAALPLVFFIKKPAVAWSKLIAYGILMGVIQFALIFTALAWGFPAGLASVVLQVQPFFTIALSVLILHERLRPVSILGALIAFSGIAIIAVERLQPTSLVLLAMVMGAALSWAGSNLVSKTAGDIDKFAFLVWSCLIPPIPLFAGALIVEGPATIAHALVHPGWGGIAAVFYTGWASTLVAYGIWNILLHRHPASVVAPFSLLVPVFGVGSTVLVLGERFTLPEIAGSLIVIFGLVINMLGTRARRNISLPS